MPHPDHLRTRLENATDEREKHDALWEIITDILDSLELALDAVQSPLVREEVLETVKDYVSNYYGDD